MPLSINVGLSRKASRNYQSTGVSINVTAELDQSLLARPDELQQQINNLYAQASQALDRHSTDPGRNETEAPPSRKPPQSARSNGYGRNGNGNANRPRSNGNGNGGGMTESQHRAILAIARRAGADPAYEAEQIIGAALDDLTVRQASELIDHLKAMAPTGTGH